MSNEPEKIDLVDIADTRLSLEDVEGGGQVLVVRLISKGMRGDALGSVINPAFGAMLVRLWNAEAKRAAEERGMEATK